MKKLIALVLTLMLLTLLALPAWADTIDPGPAPTDPVGGMTNANQWITNDLDWSGNYYGTENANGQPFNHQTWETGIQTRSGLGHPIIFGDPSPPDSTGVSRYLGETKYGENFTNIAHPIDAMDVQYLDQLNWVPDPWNNWEQIDAKVAGDYGISEKTWVDGKHYVGHSQHDMRLEAYNGLVDTDPQYIADESPDNLTVPWENYVHVWDPPSYWTWGMGIMYDIGSDMSLTLDQATTVYYKTVPLPPWFMSQGLMVTPATATINVGSTQQYTATYTGPSGQTQDVTTSSTWTNNNVSVATIGSNAGLATGVAAGTTNITASYAPLSGSALAGTATLTVQQAQQSGGSQTGTGTSGTGTSGTGSNGGGPTGQVSGALSFTAVSQAGASRPAGTAEWTDMVTARLTSDAPPAPTASSPNYVTGWTWSISNVTLNYPAQAQPGSNGTGGFSFGYPVDPPGQMENGVYLATTLTPVSMTTQSGSTANTSFREAWSMDGVGSGRGIYSIIKKPPGIMAATATPFDITAAWTVQSKWTLMVYEGKNLDGNPIFSPEPESQNYTGTCSGTLKVNGSGVNSLGNNNNGN
jgi:hypothetical protein